MRERRFTRKQLEMPDARCARLARKQWGVLHVHELHACRLTDKAITRRVQSGRLFPYFQSVYAVGHLGIPLEGLFLAAIKACGPEAVLSHYSAAALFGWTKWDGREPEVTAPTRRRHPGIRTHRAQVVDRVHVQGIPVTPPARTVIDLSATQPPRLLRRAVNEGLNQRQIKPLDLVTSGHRGARKLREILATAAPTRSEFEDITLAILTRGGLPMPEVNAPQQRYYPDFRWTARRVILEADGARFHEQMLARADDARRQRDLETRGFTVLRTTWREVTLRPDRVVAHVRAALHGAPALEGAVA